MKVQSPQWLTQQPEEDGMPGLLLIGVDHRSADLELREKVAYGAEDGNDLLTRLMASEEIAEASVLSTCNRTELYLLPTRVEGAAAYRLGLEEAFLTRDPRIEAEGRFFVKHGDEAARHLFEVASGLQSMILGEPEILGQVKRAAERSERLASTGSVLRRLLRSAIDAAGRARGATAIGAGAVSFGFAVVDLTRSIFQRMDRCSVLLVGAGETSRQVARSFHESGVASLKVVNRSRERAEAMREMAPGIEVLPFEARYQALLESDVVVASTGALEPVILHSEVARDIDSRRGRPLLLADLGVPRNIESEVGELENVFLQDIDSLEDLISRNLKRRREEIPRVQEILERELERFEAWCRRQTAEPVVERLQKWAEALRQGELEAARTRFPEETHEQLERFTRSLVRKLLHHPSRQLRRGELDEETLRVASRLFQLDGE